MRLSARLSLFLTLAWTLVLFGGWALLAERTSEAAPPAYDPDLEFKEPVHIPVGDDPRGIAVVGDKVYAANHDDGTISVIDAATLTVTHFISANSNPCAMAYNPNNGYLYVTNRTTNGTVTVVSTTTDVTVTKIYLDGEDYPTGIAFNPNDGFIYVAMNNTSSGNVVKVINSTTVIDTITDSSFDWPTHIAVKEASNLLYVANGNGTVSIIDGPTRAVTNSIPLGLQDLWGIAVNQSTGYVYAAAYTSGDQLGVINPDDTYTVTPKLVPGAALRMVAVDPDQNLVFVTKDDGQTVFVYDPENNNWVYELEITVQQDPERGIAFDPVRHRLYVSNRISNTVTVIQELISKLYFPLIMKASS